MSGKLIDIFDGSFGFGDPPHIEFILYFFDISFSKLSNENLEALITRGRKGIPAAIVHQVWQRDDYCCVNELSDGRCGSKIGLQVDHIRPVAFGQDNRLENLRLLCRQCNVAAAEKILGVAVMERYRWLKSRVQVN